VRRLSGILLTHKYLRSQAVVIEAMVLVLDFDRTLNRLCPSWVRSIRDLAPLELRSENNRALWDWIIAHLCKVDYPPHETAIETIRLLMDEASMMVINTGRPEVLRQMSERWVARFLPIDMMWMRNNEDFRSTADVKRDNIEVLLRSHNADDIFAFDDSDAAIKAYSEAGINSLRAPDCWADLLTGMRERALDESAAAVLKRCAAKSLPNCSKRRTEE
jgi:hypothetical protein